MCVSLLADESSAVRACVCVCVREEENAPGPPGLALPREDQRAGAMSHLPAPHQRGPHLRGPQGRAMSAEERSSTPAHKTSTPTHKSMSSSSSSQRDSRQVGLGGGGEVGVWRGQGGPVPL